MGGQVRLARGRAARQAGVVRASRRAAKSESGQARARAERQERERTGKMEELDERERGTRKVGKATSKIDGKTCGIETGERSRWATQTSKPSGRDRHAGEQRGRATTMGVSEDIALGDNKSVL